MIFGYVRVSTQRQSLDRQIRNILRAYPDIDKIYKEKATGTRMDIRAEFQKMIQAAAPGDVLVFDSVSRFSRQADEGFELFKDLYTRGIDCVFLNEPMINTENYRTALSASVPETGDQIADLYIEATNKALLILAERQFKQSFDQAEKEVKDLSKRTTEGMRASGAPQKIAESRTGKRFITAKEKDIKPKIKKLSQTFGGQLNDTELIGMLNISRNTFYKYKKELATAL